MNQLEVKGYVKPGFEPVREKFVEQAALVGTGGSDGAGGFVQLSCVDVAGDDASTQGRSFLTDQTSETAGSARDHNDFTVDVVFAHTAFYLVRWETRLVWLARSEQEG